MNRITIIKFTLVIIVFLLNLNCCNEKKTTLMLIERSFDIFDCDTLQKYEIKRYTNCNNKILKEEYLNPQRSIENRISNYDYSNDTVLITINLYNENCINRITQVKDSDGNIVQTIFFNKLNSYIDSSFCIYNSNRKKIQINRFRIDTEYPDTRFYLTKYYYDNKNRLIKEQHFSLTQKADTILNSYFLYKYNQYSKVIDERKFDEDNKLSIHINYIYDDIGNLVKEERKNIDGPFDVVITYKYDDRDLLIEEIIDYSDSPNIYIKYYDYDSHDNIIKESGYDYPKENPKEKGRLRNYIIREYKTQ